MHSGAVGQNDTDRCFVILDVNLSSRIGGWAQHQVSHLRSRLVYAVELVNVQRDGQDVTWELQPWGVTVRCPHPHAELFKWDRGVYVDLQKIVPNRVLHDMFNDELFRTRLDTSSNLFVQVLTTHMSSVRFRRSCIASSSHFITGLLTLSSTACVNVRGQLSRCVMRHCLPT